MAAQLYSLANGKVYTDLSEIHWRTSKCVVDTVFKQKHKNTHKYTAENAVMKIHELLPIKLDKKLVLPLLNPPTDANHFAQIKDLMHQPTKGYVNQPNEKYADLDAVTIKAGGGVNGPKHPADIRVDHQTATPHLITQPMQNTVNQKHQLHQDFINYMNRDQ